MKTYCIISASFLIAWGLTGCGASQNQTGTLSQAQQTSQILDRMGPPLSTVDSDPNVVNSYACGNCGVEICHLPPGNPDNKHTLCIGPAAVPHHLKEHERDGVGDYLGACDGGVGTGTTSDSGTGGVGTGTTSGSVGTGTTSSSNGDQIIDCTNPANASNPLCQ